MAKRIRTDGIETGRASLDPQAQENMMISLAIQLAEKQLRDGTASSQVLTHYLKLATEERQLEKRILEKQAELIDAKTESLRSTKRLDEVYEQAMKAMRSYSGDEEEEDVVE